MEAGANADQADVDGWTPLRAAAWGGHTEVSNRKYSCTNVFHLVLLEPVFFFLSKLVEGIFFLMQC